MVSQTIECIVPIAFKEAIEVLGPQFEAESGHRLEITHMLNPEVPGFIANGAQWDIAMTNPWHIDEIIAAGHTQASSHQPLGRSPLAFAIQGSKTVTLLKTAQEIAKMLRDVESIAITGVGTSGGMFRNLAKKLGVLADIESAIKPMAGGEPIKALVAGEVEMATVPLTNIVTIEGIIPVATCPEDLGVHIDLAFCLNPVAAKPAQALADWLASPERDAGLAALGAPRFN